MISFSIDVARSELLLAFGPLLFKGRESREWGQVGPRRRSVDCNNVSSHDRVRESSAMKRPPGATQLILSGHDSKGMTEMICGGFSL